MQDQYHNSISTNTCKNPTSTLWALFLQHIPPDSARTGYTTKEALFFSTQLSTDTLSALWKVSVLIRLWKQQIYIYRYVTQHLSTHVNMRHICPGYCIKLYYSGQYIKVVLHRSVIWVHNVGALKTLHPVNVSVCLFSLGFTIVKHCKFLDRFHHHPVNVWVFSTFHKHCKFLDSFHHHPVNV